MRVSTNCHRGKEYNMIRRITVILLMGFLLSCSTIKNVDNSSSGEPLPRLVSQNGTTSLSVNDKPYLILAGELHNSSTGSEYYMESIWPKLAAKNINTVLAPVTWELIEPKEGEFDYSVLDAMVKGARKEDLQLVLLWFGSWKNAKSTYVPEWVKKDPKRFPLVKTQSGETLNTVSPMGGNILSAEEKAFEAFMNHLKAIDSKYRTVVMVQIENEVGLLGTPRDYSDLGNEAFARPVPEKLVRYMQKNENSLYPALQNVWDKKNDQNYGNWEEVFGESEVYNGEDWKNNFSHYTEEIFMAWHFSHHIGRLAEVGKSIYDVPMYANAWLKQPRAKNPGDYPSGGPLPHVIDVWRAAAPSIDFIAPDIYAVGEFDWISSEFQRSGNPLFIPETKVGPDGAARAFYAYGEHNALGYAPFGIDGGGNFNTADPEDSSIQRVYGALSSVADTISQYRGTERMRGLYLGEGEKSSSVTFGKYIVTINRFSSAGLFKMTGGLFGIPGEEDTSPAGALIIKTDNDEFLVVGGVGGISVNVTGNPSELQESNVGYASVDRLYAQGDDFVHHRLNGDETAMGGPIVKPGDVGIFRLKMYTY